MNYCREQLTSYNFNAYDMIIIQQQSIFFNLNNINVQGYSGYFNS